MRRIESRRGISFGCTAALLSIGLAMGCGDNRGGNEGSAAGDTAQGAAPPAAAPAADSPQAAGGGAGGAGGAGGGAGGGAASADITPAMIAMGDSIFHGQLAGGTCVACHGPGGKGSQVGPNLADSEWLDGDGSYQSLVQIVTNGVPKPKKFPAPMPPMGGASLTPEQVRAVAAYEYSLSHPNP